MSIQVKTNVNTTWKEMFTAACKYMTTWNWFVIGTLASEYPHFKSSPINFAFQLVNDLLPYCKHSYCKAEILTFRSWLKPLILNYQQLPFERKRQSRVIGHFVKLFIKTLIDLFFWFPRMLFLYSSIGGIFLVIFLQLFGIYLHLFQYVGNGFSPITILEKENLKNTV